MEDLTDGVQSVFKQLVTEADWLTNATKVKTFCETLTSLFHCYILARAQIYKCQQTAVKRRGDRNFRKFSIKYNWFKEIINIGL